MDTKETVTLDARDRHRLFVLDHVRAGHLTAEEAARALRLSVRQVRRLLRGLREEGVAVLVHGNRGRSPAHRTPDTLRERLVGLATTTYAGVSRAHLAELLGEREGLVVPERTLRRILAEAGVAPVRRRRPRHHRSRRERMGRAGELLQVDGSRHRWLGPDRPFLTLVGAVDDATGIVTAGTFREQEDAAGYLAVLTATIRAHGLPMAVYSDRHTLFVADRPRRPTLEEQLEGREPRTQVGRALEQAGIGWIGARSPQAKGRVERLWGTLQDRLVTELRLAGAASLGDANEVLAGYLPRYNGRFAVPPADPAPAWQAWDLIDPLEAVFCLQYPRRVANDATVAWQGRALALPRPAQGSWAGRAVTIEHRLDGSLWAGHRGEPLPLVEAPPGPVTLRAGRGSSAGGGPTSATLATRPPRSRAFPAPSDHPWRRPLR
jgi:transposase